MAMTKAERAVVDELRMKLALRWPDADLKPPLFGFGDYDRPYGGAPVVGTYFVATYKNVEKVVLEIPEGRSWSWRWNGKDSCIRGPYYHNEVDAWVNVLWRQCANAARDLAPIWQHLAAAREADPS